MPRARTGRAYAPRISGHQAVRALCFASIVGVIVWGLLTVNLLPRANEVLPGEVSQTNVFSSRKLTYTSQVKTKAERDRAAAAVQEVVEIDLPLVQRQRAGLNSLLQAISAARNAPGLTPDQRQDRVAGLGQPALDTTTANWLASLDDARWYMVSSESQRLLWDALKDRLPESRVSETLRALPVRASDQLIETERSLAVGLASRFIVGNLTPDVEATARSRREAGEAVAPIQVTVERMESVLREGQVVTAEDIEKLEVLGLRHPSIDWRQFAAAGLVAAIAVGLVSAYIAAFQPSLVGRERALGLLGLLVVVTVLAAKILIVPARPLWVYMFPLPAVAMVVTTLLDGRLALVMTASLAVVVAFIASGSLEVAVIGLVTGVVASVAQWRRERLQAYFVTGTLVSVAQGLVVLTFQLAQRGEEWQVLPFIVVACVANGFLSATLAVGTVSLLGRMFGITTTMQLLELANPTQPLLRRLLMEAPGTYHHSIMVGNLGERAAEEVGADPLLVRVGAYYHDIGKLRRPYFFVENQAGGENVHETLAPDVSADLIRAHVRDGVELCQQYGVPAGVRELIPQHHGTRLVSFFYHQAQDAAAAAGDPEPDVKQYSYPGPRPQSKEGAILMLADSVEAAARASKDHSGEAIGALVDRLVMQRVAEGQLDDCDLTLRDVQRIKDAFRAILVGMYHPRIEYPERAKDALGTMPRVEAPAAIGDGAR